MLKGALGRRPALDAIQRILYDYAFEGGRILDVGCGDGVLLSLITSVRECARLTECLSMAGKITYAQITFAISSSNTGIPSPVAADTGNTFKPRLLK